MTSLASEHDEFVDLFWCRTCIRLKPRSEFHRCKSTKSGVISNCKTCENMFRRASIKAENAATVTMRMNGVKIVAGRVKYQCALCSSFRLIEYYKTSSVETDRQRVCMPCQKEQRRLERNRQDRIKYQASRRNQSHNGIRFGERSEFLDWMYDCSADIADGCMTVDEARTIAREHCTRCHVRMSKWHRENFERVICEPYWDEKVTT